MNACMFSSATDDWETPITLFNELDAEFHFDLDVCATAQNRKCSSFFSIEEDGLKQKWGGRCWMNPPYGRQIGKWVRKAYESTLDTAEIVVCLLPARTDTAWWHDWVIPHAADIRFIRGRLKFSNSKSSAPFPSAIVVFKKAETISGGQA